MQKLINVMAVCSFAVSAAVVTGTTYLYLEKDQLVQQAKEQAMEELRAVMEAQLGDLLFSGPGDPTIPDLPDPTRIDETGAQPIPVVPFGM